VAVSPADELVFPHTYTPRGATAAAACRWSEKLEVGNVGGG